MSDNIRSGVEHKIKIAISIYIVYMMPRSFISADGFGITARCRRYLEPLIRGEDYPPYQKNGLPKYVQLKNVPVKKKLPESFKV